MAEDLAGRAPLVATSEQAAKAPKEEEHRPAHRSRFLIAYLVLGLAAGAGLAGGVVLFGGAERVSGAAWSDWKPTGDESTYPAQIADFVARRYRLPSNNQLVAIVPGPPEVGAGSQSVPIRAVAIQLPNATSTEDIQVLPAEDSVMYRFCGLGEDCSIREGEPTEERHRLLRREALELSLYTFKYVEGIDSVIAFLPPRPPPPRYVTRQQNDGRWRVLDTATGDLSLQIFATEAEAQGLAATLNPKSTAVFFQKRDFAAELERPLAETLSRTDPLAVTAAVGPVESIKVDRLTRPHLFTFDFQPLQEGSAVIVLAPLRTAG